MDNIEKMVAFILGFILIFVIFIYSIAWLGSCTNTTFTVTDKERINKSEESYYLVFTEGEVFKNEDSILKWKWNSSDVYGELKEGGKYTCQVCGFRIRFLSMYRNIIKFK